MAIHIQRRELLVTLGGAAAAWPLAALAQQPTAKIPRIGWLVTGSPAPYRFSLEAFREGLKALGYLEGLNIIIEYRWAEGNVARLPELAHDLVEQKVDIILAGGSVGAEAAKQATSSIPIVAAGVGDLSPSRFPSETSATSWMRWMRSRASRTAASCSRLTSRRWSIAI